MGSRMAHPTHSQPYRYVMLLGLGLGLEDSPSPVCKTSLKIRITLQSMQIPRPLTQSGNTFVSEAVVKGSEVILLQGKVRETSPVTRPRPELSKHFFSRPPSHHSDRDMVTFLL